MAPTTPAAIDSEATAAHRTDYEPLLHLERIHVHPHNPRHDAVADDELIASIRDQGLIHDLVVAPHPEIEGDFILIDGHRRFDGLTRAGYTYAPAKIRLDLVDEADQIAAMLATIRRQDLTPIEEAEGFDLLAELGWTVDQIAAATGRSASTVKARRKLTSLKVTFQEQVAAGQVTLDDAIALASLPEKEQKRLEKTPATQMAYEIKRSRARAEQQREVDKDIKHLKSLGATQQELPRGAYYWGLNDAVHGLTIFPNLPEPLRQDTAHHGCLGWFDDGTAQYPSIKRVCTNVSKHDDEISAHHAKIAAERTDEEKAQQAERDARAAEAEAEREERAAQGQARRVAAQMRGDVVLDATRKVKIPAVLEPILRGALLGMLDDWPLDEKLFQELARVPADLRWSTWGEDAAFKESIPDLAADALWRTFVAAIVAHTESNIDETLRENTVYRSWEPVVYGTYLDALIGAGHQLTPPDEDLQRILAEAAAKGDES